MIKFILWTVMCTLAIGWLAWDDVTGRQTNSSDTVHQCWNAQGIVPCDAVDAISN